MLAPGSGTTGTPPTITNLSVTCTTDRGSVVAFTAVKNLSGAVLSLTLTNAVSGNEVWAGGFGSSTSSAPFQIVGTANGDYVLRADNGQAFRDYPVQIDCGASGAGAGCDLLATAVAVAPPAAGAYGSLRLSFTTSSPPVQVYLRGLNLAHILQGPTQNLAPGSYDYTGTADPGTPYLIELTDAAGCKATATATIPAFVPVPVPGCTDPYATNYNPAATQNNGSCTYGARWRSAWAPMEVSVAAVPAQLEAFVAAELRIGFRTGHPLAAFRPLSAPLTLRATIGPDGYATFRLGPYLRAALGAPDGRGGYRLDLNSATALTSDMYVGYELRRAVSGEMLEQGYAVNAAVPDGQLAAPGKLLSPFAQAIPAWPNIHFEQPILGSTGPLYQFGQLTQREPGFGEYTLLPCPLNPLPVAWLAPGGGYGYWVFQGRPQLGDDVSDSQSFTDAPTGERRYSQRGETRRTITATSGVFKGADLLEGLRTLVASPQVWYQPAPGGPWVPVTLDGGSFPAGRLGVARQQVSISFTEAAPRYAQGQ